MGLALTYQMFFAYPDGLPEAYEALFCKRWSVVHELPEEPAGHSWRVCELYNVGDCLVVRPNLYPLEDPQLLEDAVTLSSLFDLQVAVVTVHDGDFWAYWLFQGGIQIDQFAQDPDWGEQYFQSLDSRGNPGLAASVFKVPAEVLSGYLVRMPPQWGLDGEEEAAADHQFSVLDQKVRPEDLVSRFSECAVLDFLRFIGVPVFLEQRQVQLDAPLEQRFYFLPASRKNLAGFPA